MDLNQSIQLANHIKDVEIEYNIKLFIIFSIFIYSIVAFWLVSKWDTDRFYAKIVKVFLLQMPFGVLSIFIPLFSIFLLRDLSYERLYMLMVAFYSYSFIILMIAGKIGLFEIGADLLGFKFSPKQMKYNNK